MPNGDDLYYRTHSVVPPYNEPTRPAQDPHTPAHHPWSTRGPNHLCYTPCIIHTYSISAHHPCSTCGPSSYISHTLLTYKLQKPPLSIYLNLDLAHGLNTDNWRGILYMSNVQDIARFVSPSISRATFILNNKQRTYPTKHNQETQCR